MEEMNKASMYKISFMGNFHAPQECHSPKSLLMHQHRSPNPFVLGIYGLHYKGQLIKLLEEEWACIPMAEKKSPNSDSEHSE